MYILTLREGQTEWKQKWNVASSMLAAFDGNWENKFLQFYLKITVKQNARSWLFYFSFSVTQTKFHNIPFFLQYLKVGLNLLVKVDSFLRCS